MSSTGAVRQSIVNRAIIYRLEGHPERARLERLAGVRVDVLKEVFDNGRTRCFVRPADDKEADPIWIRKRFLQDIKPREESTRRTAPPQQRQSFRR